MSEVTEIKNAVEQAAGPAAAQVEAILTQAEQGFLAKYKTKLIVGAALLLIVLAVGLYHIL